MPGKSNSTPMGGFRYLVLAASLMTFLLIVVGGVVRVTESGLGCPDWPLCYGRLLPPWRLDALLEYSHRLIASLTTPFILAAAIVAAWRHRSVGLVFRPMMASLGLLLVEIGLGAVTVLTETPPVIVAVHLGVALSLLALLLTATVTAFRLQQGQPGVERLDFRSPFARLSLWALGWLFVVLLSGVFVAATASTAACAGWPLCSGRLIPPYPLAWIHMAHRFIVGAASVAMIVLMFRAWRTQRGSTAVYSAAALTAVFFFAQAYVGALKTTRGFPQSLLALHVASAAATWAAMVVLAVLAGSQAAAPRRKQEQPARPAPGRYARDLLTLTRPVVVLLLLVTAFGGMVLGGRAWPSFGLAFWTLLGGGLAAGGAQAVNQYVDRDIDRLMARTAKRPIPAGRLTPAEGLAWGLSLCVASLYLLAGQVGLLAALITLVGILYYVIAYTLMLKRTSVQNIVIGGGAGAMAPVVGLVAVTGRLDLSALFLFVLVFLWTPPHFWALALVRLKDYRQAKIPVMPVVRGEASTRAQIMLYTVGLLVVSLLPPLVRAAGLLYLGAALVLGAAMLYAAWSVWRQASNKHAWRLYRVSSLYLAFLFAALVADTLLRP
jgi:protoheme IX farnesyltransferase